MATDQPPPDDLDPGHVLAVDEWAAVETQRQWIEQMKTPLTPAEQAAVEQAEREAGDGDAVQS